MERTWNYPPTHAKMEGAPFNPSAGVDSIRSSIGSCGSTHHRFTACAHMLAEGGRMLSAATNYGQLLKTETSYRVDLKYQFIISVDSWTEEQTNIIPLV